MKLESMNPTTNREKAIRRQAHARAVLKGITMHQAVFQALEVWLKEENAEHKEKTRQV